MWTAGGEGKKTESPKLELLFSCTLFRALKGIFEYHPKKLTDFARIYTETAVN